jgi:hypothetical protein
VSARRPPAVPESVSPIDRSVSTARSFRPTSRRRARVAGGVALSAAAIGGNVLIYSSINHSTEVVQLVTNVRAGDQITEADLRVVEVDLDPTVPSIAADGLGALVGQYARTYLPAGSLAIPQIVQRTPLVSPGTGVVAIVVAGGGSPSGLIERSRVQLVYSDGESLVVVDGRVVARGADPDDVAGVGLTVEVPVATAASLAAANDVRVVLLEADVDPALTPTAGG